MEVILFGFGLHVTDHFIHYTKEMYEVAIEGKVKILQSEDDDYLLEEEGKLYKSEILEDPTWVDLLQQGLKQAECNNNFHHTFLEAIEVLREENGIKIIRLSMGS